MSAAFPPEQPDEQAVGDSTHFDSGDEFEFSDPYAIRDAALEMMSGLVHDLPIESTASLSGDQLSEIQFLQLAAIAPSATLGACEAHGKRLLYSLKQGPPPQELWMTCGSGCSVRIR